MITQSSQVNGLSVGLSSPVLIFLGGFSRSALSLMDHQGRPRKPVNFQGHLGYQSPAVLGAGMAVKPHSAALPPSQS